MDRHGDAARGRRGHTTRWSVVRDVVRQTVTQRRLPPQVVAYGRALVADRWSRARRRVRRALSAPVRHRRRGTDPAAPRVVHSGGRRQAAVPFGFTTVREVAEDNLRRVADLFERAGVAYHVRDAAGPGPITVMVDAMRHLWLGAPAGNSVWGAVVWALALIAVFAPLAVWRYRRSALR